MIHAEFTSDIGKRLGQALRRVADPSETLRVFNEMKRREVAQRFASEGPGWAPRKEESRGYGARAKPSAIRKIGMKLRRELTRAQRSDDPLTSYRRREVLAEFQRLVNGGSPALRLTEAPTRADRTLAKQRSAIVREVRSNKRAGHKEEVSRLEGELKRFDEQNKDRIEVLAGERLRQSIVGLDARIQRAEAKGAGRLLAGLARGVKSKVTKSGLTISHPWPAAGVHNAGGKVGNNATLPRRTFLEWSEADVELLAGIVLKLAEE
jgi:phage gpG-like protein